MKVRKRVGLLVWDLSLGFDVNWRFLCVHLRNGQGKTVGMCKMRSRTRCGRKQQKQFNYFQAQNKCTTRGEWLVLQLAIGRPF